MKDDLTGIHPVYSGREKRLVVPRQPTRAELLASANKQLRGRASWRAAPEQGYRPTLADIAPELAERAACAARETRKRRTVALATEVADRIIDSAPVILAPLAR
jgi:predicted nucleic acid-binding protein